MLRFVLTCVLCACTSLVTMAQDWTLQNPLPDPVSLYDVYIDTAGFGWTGGEASKVYYTTDFGQTWEERSLPTSFGNIFYLDYVPGSNGQHVVVAGGKTAYSLDAGQTWTEVPITSVTTGAFNGIRAMADTAIYLISNRGLLFKSPDGGASWNQITLPLEEEWKSLDFVDVNTGWLGSIAGKILKTTDGGQTWSVDSSHNSLIKLDFLDADIGFMVDGQDFLKTEDGGDSWDLVVPVTFTFAINDIAAIDSQNILVAQGARMAVTHDGGQSWLSNFNHPYVGTTNRGIDAHADGKAWAANRWRSMLYTEDAGDTWVDQFPAFKGFLGFVDAYDKQHVLAAGNRSHLIRTSNSGLDWEELTDNLPPDTDSEGIEMLSDSVYVMVAGDEVLSSRDAGMTWVVDTAIGTGFFRVLTADPMHNLFALHSGGDIYASTDSGRSWLLIEVPSTQARGTAWLSREVGMASATAGRVYRTEDGGLSWDTVETGATSTLANMTWASDEHVWVLRSGFSDSILYSKDGGMSWAGSALPRRTSWRNLVFEDSLKGWVVGGTSTAGYIAATTDGGQTWTEVRAGMLPYFDVTFPSTTDTTMVWACGSGGGVEFFGTIDTMVDDTNTVSIWQQASTDWNLYPNPSQGSLSMETPYGPEQAVEVQVFDLQGRMLESYAWETVPASIDLSHLPDGWYLVRLHQGNRIAFRRWHKQ